MAVKGFDAASFRRTLRDLDRQTRADVREAVTRGSHALAAEIRTRAPVASGELRDSVEVEPVRIVGDRITQAVVVGDDIRPHAAQVEFGTSTEAPHPYFRPAVIETEPARVRLIEGAFPTS